MSIYAYSVYMGVTMYIHFVLGVDANICVRMALTCCPLEVERAIDDAAFENTRNMMPPYSLYLNESDRVFFAHYGQCVI